MDDFKKDTIINHLKCIKKTALVYFLAVALGWAAYPLFLALFARYTTMNVPMAIYSVVITVIFAVMLVADANEFGLTDRKPYKWARYKAKGFVIGAVVGVLVFLLELLIIFIADRVLRVSHPQFDIANINNYLRMALYSPFFWFYEIIKKGSSVVPRVTVLSSLFVVPFTSVFTGIGYLLGLRGVDIDLKLKRKKKDE